MKASIDPELTQDWFGQAQNVHIKDGLKYL